MANSQSAYEQYHTLTSVELYEVTEDSEGKETKTLVEKQELPSDLEVLEQTLFSNQKGTVSSEQSVGDILIVAKNLIALGKEVYKIIEAGKPVVTMESTPVSVLPKDEKGKPVSAFQLSNWSAPRVKKYKVETRNYMGMNPVSFEFMIIFSYGGKHAGKGAYLNGAQIKPTDVQVSWGYNLDATFHVQSILNQGTAEDPVAGAVLMIDYTIKTVLKEIKQNRTFFINGLGKTQAY